MSFHFIKAKLVIVVDLYMIPRKNASQDIESKTFYDRRNIKVLLSIVYKIKLEFLINLNTRVRCIRKSPLGKKGNSEENGT